jgi:MFS family permease
MPSNAGRLARQGEGALVLFCHSFDGPAAIVLLAVWRNELGLSHALLTWMVAATLLGYVGACGIGGRLSDVYGRRRTLRVALAGFIAATLAGAVVSDGVLIVVTRYLRGVATACALPAAFGTAVAGLDGERRDRAVRTYSGLGIVGYSAGYVIAGWVGPVSWRVAYGCVVIIAVVALCLSHHVDDERQPLRGGWDVWGGLTLTAGASFAVYAIVEWRRVGWESWQVAGGMAGAVTSLSALVAVESFVERRGREPLVRLALMKDPTVVRLCLFALAVNGGQIGYQLVITDYLTGAGVSTFSAAVVFVPMGVVMSVGMPLSGWLGRSLDASTSLVVGMSITLVAYLNLLLVNEIRMLWAAIAAIVGTIVLAGVGYVVKYPPMIAEARVGGAGEGVVLGLVLLSYGIGGALGGTLARVSDSFVVGIAVTLIWPVIGIAVAVPNALSRRARVRT